MAKKIFALFDNRSDADAAIIELNSTGIRSEDISVVVRDQGNETVVNNVGSGTTDMAAEGILSGAATGGMVGGLAGLLIGIGAITLPGIGGLLIGGPLAAALGLTGAAATTVSGALTGALAGGLVGGLVGLGVPENEARVYEEGIGKGGVMVGVIADIFDDNLVRRIFQDHAARQITFVQ